MANRQRDKSSWRYWSCPGGHEGWLPYAALLHTHIHVGASSPPHVFKSRASTLLPSMPTPRTSVPRLPWSNQQFGTLYLRLLLAGRGCQGPKVVFPTTDHRQVTSVPEVSTLPFPPETRDWTLKQQSRLAPRGPLHACERRCGGETMSWRDTMELSATEVEHGPRTDFVRCRLTVRGKACGERGVRGRVSARTKQTMCLVSGRNQEWDPRSHFALHRREGRDKEEASWSRRWCGWVWV